MIAACGSPRSRTSVASGCARACGRDERLGTVDVRTRRDEDDAGGPLTGETLTARAADLFNVATRCCCRCCTGCSRASTSPRPRRGPCQCRRRLDVRRHRATRPDAGDHAGGTGASRRHHWCAVRALLPTGLPAATSPCGVAVVRRATRRRGIVRDRLSGTLEPVSAVAAALTGNAQRLRSATTSHG
jgi:hypothetical protein